MKPDNNSKDNKGKQQPKIPKAVLDKKLLEKEKQVADKKIIKK
jgi:hypothetical protein